MTDIRLSDTSLVDLTRASHNMRLSKRIVIIQFSYVFGNPIEEAGTRGTMNEALAIAMFFPGIGNVGDLNRPGVRIETFHTRFSASLPIGEKIRSGWLACARRDSRPANTTATAPRVPGIMSTEEARLLPSRLKRLDRERLCGNAGKNYSMPHAAATLGTNSFIEERISPVK
jgi:hypothetical protein